MSKFKEGDKVRVLNNSETEHLQKETGWQIIGATGKIEGVGTMYLGKFCQYIILGNGALVRIPEEDLVKVES